MNTMQRTAVALVAMALALASLTAEADAQRPATRRGATAPSPRRAAPHPRTTGLMVGVHTIAAPGVKVTGEDIDNYFGTNFGTGAGLMVGYGFNERFSSFVSLDLARQQTPADMDPNGSFGLAHFEIGARANLPMQGRPSTLPYVSASVGRRALGARVTDLDTGDEADVSLSGKMFALGGGVEHWLSPTVSLDGGLTLGFGKFDQLDWDGDKDNWQVNGSTSIRMRVGVTWRP
jgi:hypothetical protein